MISLGMEGSSQVSQRVTIEGLCDFMIRLISSIAGSRLLTLAVKFFSVYL